MNQEYDELLGSFLSGSGGQGMLLLKRGSEYRKLQPSPLASIFFSSIPPTPMRSSSSFRCGNDIHTEKTCCHEKIEVIMYTMFGLVEFKMSGFVICNIVMCR